MIMPSLKNSMIMDMRMQELSSRKVYILEDRERSVNTAA